MFMKFNSKNKTIFLDPKSSGYDISKDEKLNIILSPSLYWVKKITQSFKSVRDAKKYLPSIFEDILPDGNYSYDTYKEGGEFFIFAYEDRVILDILSKFGISSANITNIYFAQSEIAHIEGAVKVNEQQSIYVKDDIVVLVPCCWIEESGNLNLDEIKLSKRKVAIQQYAHIVDNSSLYKIGAILLVMSILLLGEYIITLSKTQKIEKLKDELFVKYKLKPTMMQNRSMLKKYTKIHNKQTKIREYISLLLSIKLRDAEVFSLLNMSSKSLDAEFSSATNATMIKIEKALKAKKIKYNIELQDSVVHLEMLL